MEGLESVALDMSVLQLADDITLFGALLRCREPVCAGRRARNAAKRTINAP